MKKYNYDKKVLKNLDVKNFLNETKTRNDMINKAQATIPSSVTSANVLAESLHPSMQMVKVSDVKEYKNIGKIFTLVPDVEKGTKKLAYFRAGQYISVLLFFDGCSTCRPYSICSSPKNALGNDGTFYKIAVANMGDKGFVSKYINENWKIGTEIVISGPLGDFYYNRLRDARHIIGIAGGVTPFLAMAEAIVAGIEDFELTILCQGKSYKDIFLYEELDEVAKKANGKIKLIYVLSDEKREGCEYGKITAELIKKYSYNKDYSLYLDIPIFMRGTSIMDEINKLNLPRKRIRYDIGNEYANFAEIRKNLEPVKDKNFNLKVIIGDTETNLSCKADETILTALERNNILLITDCRNGHCGFCRSKLIKGEIYVPEKQDGRRAADKKFGWIHPCVTYPMSDLIMEIYPL